MRSLVMPFRISIPLPGPVSWSPSRRKKAPAPNLTPEQWEAIGRRINDAGERWGQRAEAAAERLDQRLTAADERHQVWHDKRMAEMNQIKQLPPWPRFVAAMKFPFQKKP